MKKNIMNIAAVNELNWYMNEATKEKMSKLPLKVQWTIRKNMKVLEPLSQNFTDFRDELIQKRNNEWFEEGNGKCERSTQKDADGNDQEVLKILDEYMDEYREYENDMNRQLNDILVETNEVSLFPINIEEFVEIADQYDTGIDLDDIDMLSMFEEEIEHVEAEVVSEG